MVDGEIYLLQAVRDYLRQSIPLEENQCDCEPDDIPPAMVGDLYVAVVPAGCDKGPRHDSSGAVQDSIHSVSVTAFQRMGAVPRDRRRNVYLDKLKGVNVLLSKVIAAIDWRNEVFLLANQLMLADIQNADPFLKPLYVSRVDPKPRVVTPDTYDGANQAGPGATPYVAMARSVVFTGCRRVQGIVK